MARKKLIFFAAADPRESPRPTWTAYHFADVANRAGLETEVRLAGRAVLVAREDGVNDDEAGREVRQKACDAADAPFTVSLCPNCVRRTGVSDEHMASIGGELRDLADILTEVADGISEFVYLG